MSLEGVFPRSAIEHYLYHLVERKCDELEAAKDQIERLWGIIDPDTIKNFQDGNIWHGQFAISKEELYALGDARIDLEDFGVGLKVIRLSARGKDDLKQLCWRIRYAMESLERSL